jgi:hypothetical protein
MLSIALMGWLQEGQRERGCDKLKTTGEMLSVSVCSRKLKHSCRQLRCNIIGKR